MKKKSNRKKPLVLVTAGDPLGIGPLVAIKALKNPKVRKVCDVLLVGEKKSLLKAGYKPSMANLIDIYIPQNIAKPVKKHQPSKYGGLVSFKALELGVKLANQGKVDAIITAPISKQSWAKAKVGFIGHTEYLKKYSSKKGDIAMCFVSDKIKCGLVSEHYPLSKLGKVITQEKILTSYKNFSDLLKFFGMPKPRIVVSALNPHAGDGGKLGKEEIKTIIPTIKQLKKLGYKASGPYPPDVVWGKHITGEFDGVLAMYHDNALSALKLASIKPIVHITAGLKIIRTSPTHGTAFDIAHRKIADEKSMVEAILTAVKLSKSF